MGLYHTKSLADLYSMTVPDRQQALLEWAFEEQFERGKLYPFPSVQPRDCQEETIDYWVGKLSPYKGAMPDGHLKQFESSIEKWINIKNRALNEKSSFTNQTLFFRFLDEPEPVDMIQTMRANLEPALRSISRLRMAKALFDEPPAFFKEPVSEKPIESGEVTATEMPAHWDYSQLTKAAKEKVLYIFKNRPSRKKASDDWGVELKTVDTTCERFNQKIQGFLIKNIDHQLTCVDGNE